ncbi:hypothetical protein BGZ65_012068, partial [Modicella reniformis]
IMQTRRQKARSETKEVQAGSSPDMHPGSTAGPTGTTTAKELNGIESTSLTSTPTVTVTVTPAKRKNATLSSLKKEVEIPLAATLPRIVWVYDSEYQWWPGKITQYPPEGNRAIVARFGNIEP